MNIFDIYAILDEQKIGKLRSVFNKNGEKVFQNDD